MKLWRLDDYTWWAAPTAEDGMQAYTRATGVTREEITDDGRDEPVEVTREEMDRLIFVDEDAEGNEVRRSFAEQWDKELVEGKLDRVPDYPFAVTDF